VNDYEIVALEKICGDDSYRETIEKLWMDKLRTFKPHGLNTKT
jgi:acetoin utilization deacetylase AcuC-like enzyme